MMIASYHSVGGMFQQISPPPGYGAISAADAQIPHGHRAVQVYAKSNLKSVVCVCVWNLNLTPRRRTELQALMPVQVLSLPTRNEDSRPD
jgi:hypothetical protein